MASQRQIQSPDQKTEQVSIPPHSTEAEQAVLGGIMLSNQHWDGIAERVIAEDFYTFAHKAIFQTMEELMRNQTPIDLITLDQALKAKGISDCVSLLLWEIVSQKTAILRKAKTSKWCWMKPREKCLLLLKNAVLQLKDHKM